jgi:RNA polymerase sigma-70 factor (ECF subfamily)
VASTSQHQEFTELYLACYGRLVGQLTLITGDRAEAEDVVQEALTRAAARWSRLRSYEVPELWVRRVALNLVNERRRKAARRLKLLLRLGPPPDVPPVPIEQVAVAQALRALPTGQRQVIVLHHLIGLPVDQIAAELGIPAGTVKSRLARARTALGRHLEHDPDASKELTGNG